MNQFWRIFFGMGWFNHQLVVIVKGIRIPNMAETSRFRIYNKLPFDPSEWKVCGQNIATSDDQHLANGSKFRKGNGTFQANLGWWNIIPIWPEGMNIFDLTSRYPPVAKPQEAKAGLQLTHWRIWLLPEGWVEKKYGAGGIYNTLGMAPFEDASDHQDYEPFLVGNPDFYLYLPLLRGKGPHPNNTWQ